MHSHVQIPINLIIHCHQNQFLKSFITIRSSELYEFLQLIQIHHWQVKKSTQHRKYFIEKDGGISAEIFSGNDVFLLGTNEKDKDILPRSRRTGRERVFTPFVSTWVNKINSVKRCIYLKYLERIEVFKYQ